MVPALVSVPLGGVGDVSMHGGILTLRLKAPSSFWFNSGKF